jgi:pimeloyl-ACP methyl ester carboxylesterase
VPQHEQPHATGSLQFSMMLLIAALISMTTGAEAVEPELASIWYKASSLVSEDFMIASDTPGIELYVRNKRFADHKPSSNKTVLFVHGATYPSETSFDLKLDGLSWMDYIAAHGWNVYLVDLRGYGRSTRPSEMSDPAKKNEPIVTTDVAIRDVDSAVDFILERDNISKVNLIGWSWGTTIMGGYTAQTNNKVERLVLYAPIWIIDSPPAASGANKLGAYRQVTKEAAKKRWLRGVPKDKVDNLIPDGWFEAWADATWSSDPLSAESGLLRAPNGIIHDVRTYWMQGKSTYYPADIRVPTLVIGGNWDRDTPPYMAQAILKRLTNAPIRRRVEIGEATHTVIMEKNRMQLFREVQLFLED